ncbi:MAG: DUF1127 domain-containing protein [Alphaproteobacteria bacterium]|nr:DUF1127 domain-containing protein [Alphaproteobacteria bacterium]MCB9930083.1 DUF1127 domain-containing protein [Alphaproteobacteria bacterium]
MLGDWLTQALEPMRRAARRRQTLRELGRLDDRALADIGISRADIGRIADITARQAPDEAMTAADLHRRHP